MFHSQVLLLSISLIAITACVQKAPLEDHRTGTIPPGIYYLLDDPYTCISNTLNQEKVKSWRDSLEVTEKEALVRGDICNDQFEPVSLLEIQQITSGTIQFKGKQYQFYPQKPQLCENGWWCPVPNP